MPLALEVWSLNHWTTTATTYPSSVVSNLPAMQETTVRPLGWEDPLEKEMATHSSILAWEIKWTWWATVYAVARVGHDLVTKPPPPPPGL